MYRNLLTCLVFLLAHTFLTSQSYSGDWEGTLAIQGQSLKIIYHIVEEGGVYTATLDSPNQGAYGMAVDKVELQDGKLLLQSTALGITYLVQLNEDGSKISGSFKQGPVDTPLEMIKLFETAAETTITTSSDHPMAGTWNGKISVMGQNLRLIFHIEETDGVFSSTMDSPDQGAFGIEMEKTEVKDYEITITLARIGLTVKGTYLPDSNLINAQFSQGSVTTPFKLTRDEIEKEVLNRPQEPKNFPYEQKEIVVSHPSGEHTLAGTLTIPEGAYDKIAVLVSGSGPQDRNEELLGHKPFLVLSDFLTRNGIAVMRYDDRGVSEDALAVVNHLASMPGMTYKKIGIIGHSEGGLIAPIVHSMQKLDFIVMLAGPGIASKELLIEQQEAISRAQGVDEEDIARNKKESLEIFNYMNANLEMGDEELKSNLKEKMQKMFDSLSDEEKEEIGDLETALTQQLNSITSTWFRYFIAHDPAPYLAKVDCPLLAINGELDLQVLPESNIKGIKLAMFKNGNQNFTSHILPKLNHLFQVTETGAPSEYGTLEETFNEEAMQLVVDWLRKI